MRHGWASDGMKEVSRQPQADAAVAQEAASTPWFSWTRVTKGSQAVSEGPRLRKTEASTQGTRPDRATQSAGQQDSPTSEH